MFSKHISFQPAFVSMCIASAAVGATIRVPTDAPTIQIAIEKAQPFDTIIVAPGTYSEAINFGGKVIVVQSENPNDPQVVALTIIDGSGLGNVVTFTGGEDQVNTILDGFTITGGTRGIDGNGTPARIRRCIIRDNTSVGIYRVNGDIEDCKVIGNGSTGIFESHGTIRRCVIQGNSASGLTRCNGTLIDSRVESNLSESGVFRGSLDILRSQIAWNTGQGISSHTGNIDQSHIVGNAGSGISGTCCDAGIIRNTVIAGNRGSGFSGSRKNVLSCTVTGNRGRGFVNHTGSISHVIIWDNLSGALSGSTTPVFSGTVNPFFWQPGFWDQLNDVWVNGVYHLTPNSPYIDAGNPAYGDDLTNPTVDIDGNPRVVGARVDIGAYEFQQKCDGPDFDGDGIPDVCDPDIDDDEIPNVADRCPFSPVPLLVDGDGRPLGDLNLNCRVTLRDFAILQRQLTGP